MGGVVLMTHVRQTSIEAYRQIEAEGLLSKRLFEVYRTLFDHGPLTYSQVILELGKTKHFVSTSSYQSCLCNLRDSGVVMELGTVECPVTKRTVILWDVTDALPSSRQVRTKREEILRKIESYRKKIRALQAALERTGMRPPYETQVSMFDAAPMKGKRQ